MLCSLCKKKLPAANHKHVFISVGIQDAKIKQWAKVPIHQECIEKAEFESVACIIRKAAGIIGPEYSIDKPTNDVRTVTGKTLDDFGKCINLFREFMEDDESFRFRILNKII